MPSRPRRRSSARNSAGRRSGGARKSPPSNISFRSSNLEHVAKLTDGFQKGPTHDDASYREERFVNVGAAFVTHREAAKTMPPRQSAFDDPAGSPEAAAMRASACRQLAGDPAALELVAVRLRIV